MREGGRETGDGKQNENRRKKESKKARKNVNEAGKNGINAAICAVW